MSPPPYHLRVNKAADRFALIEAIRRLPGLGGELKEYTYYGLGGPYLEDMRLLYEFYPEITEVSIEIDKEIRKRQEFHRPCASNTLQLEVGDIGAYVRLYEPNDKKSIFWLDYTGLDFSCFGDFMALLPKLAPGSMVKVTLRADPRDYWVISRKDEKPVKSKKRETEKFRVKFDTLMPQSVTNLPWKVADFAHLVQQMLQISVQQALSAQSTNTDFHPISSFFYSDGTWMFTATGIVWTRDEGKIIKEAYKDWEFANLTWDNPRLIDIPDLSTRERLQLQHCLPCDKSPGEALYAELGYLIDEDVPKSEAALEQYAAFHRYFPYFLRGTP
jgi:hypothetical protein